MSLIENKNNYKFDLIYSFIMNLHYKSISGDEDTILPSKFRIVSSLEKLNRDSILTLEILQGRFLDKYFNINVALITVPYFSHNAFKRFLENEKILNPITVFDYFVEIESSHNDTRINLVGVILSKPEKKDLNFILDSIKRDQEILGEYKLNDTLIGYNFFFK